MSSEHTGNDVPPTEAAPTTITPTTVPASAMTADPANLPPVASSDNLAPTAYHSDALANRISDAKTSIPDAIALTRIRQEIITQDEYLADRRHVRRGETIQFFSKMIFSAGATAGGFVLVAGGAHVIEGFAMIGVGLHWLAPDFVNSTWNRILGKRNLGGGDEQ